MSRTTLALAFLTLTAILVAGCASAPSGGDPTPTPVTLTAAVSGVKTIAFAWTTVDDATEYQLNEATDGANVFTPIAILPATSTTYDHEIFLPNRSNARYTLTACTAEGCTDTSIIAIDSLIPSLIGYVKASNTGEVDRFGYAVALSDVGDALAVGALLEDSDATGIDGTQDDDASDNVDSGAVYVYTRDPNGAWHQEAYVKASNTGGGDFFGHSVALSGDGATLAVGVLLEDGAASGIAGAQDDDGASNNGAVYVYTRDEFGSWQPTAYVKASNPDASDEFGQAVALSGNETTLAVGTHREDSGATGIAGAQNDETTLDSGAVYLY